MSTEIVVPDLYRLAFIPGCFRCPKCRFVLTKTCISADTGEMGTREQDRESEPCPNDGTILVHVTYREQMANYDERLREEFARVRQLSKELASAAMSLISHEQSNGGGGGISEAFDIAAVLGYDGNLSEDDVLGWLRARISDYD